MYFTYLNKVITNPNPLQFAFNKSDLLVSGGCFLLSNVCFCIVLYCIE